jgi:nicotinate phosphoribosyltransferase
VYKLTQIGDRPVVKLSESKVSYPGAHQVYRHEKDGMFAFDHLGMVKEPSYEFVDATPLLVDAMKNGHPLHDEPLQAARDRCRAQLDKVPAEVKRVERTDKHEKIYEVRPSEQLMKLLDKLKTERHA